MASDAYMELADPNVWGETFDEKFGVDAKGGRRMGAFEIASFSFTATPKAEDGQPPAKRAAAPPARTAGAGSSGTGVAQQSHPEREFTIHKWIDASSPDLLLACCKQTQIEWAVITLREQGDVSRKPWLILEFTNLQVDEFAWELSPGATGEEAKEQETVKFRYGTILFKYQPQTPTGEHATMSVKGWNWENPNAEPTNLQSETW